MNFDIEDLASDITTGIYGDDRMSVATLNAAVAALAALVAEVERLRAEADLLRTGRDAARDYADRVEAEVLYLRGERAAVVAWLREVLAEASLPLGVSQVFDAVVDTIERGEHRREEET